MKVARPLTSFLFLLVASSVSAQLRLPVKNFPPGLSTFSMNAPLKSALVTAGSPLSYQSSINGWHALLDGTRITDPSRANTFFWRDSEGRTRTQRSLVTPSPFHTSQPKPPKIDLIEIRDPIAGVQYVFNTHDRVAYRYPFTAEPPGKPRPVSPLPVEPPPPPKPDQPKTTTESLGSKVIEGVTVDGTRRTTVFPPGWMGADRSITKICDTWLSPDLKITVLYLCSQPPNSESAFRLTNISRAEPDPSLFQPPPDYSIVDGPDRITMVLHPSPQ